MDFKFNEININPDFSDWASNFSGIAGGNLNAPLWTCGIEFYGEDILDFKVNERYTYKNTEGKIIPCINDNHKSDFKETTPFIQKLIKLACYYFEKDLDNNIYKKYLNDLFTENGKTFGMNLYPISFPNSSDNEWKENHFNKTGLPNKQMYKVWCMVYRFPFLRKLASEYKPKILICTGLNFRQDFLLAFAPDQLFSNPIQAENIDNRMCEFFRINNKKTLLVLTPFFGRGGIMSDKGLKQLADLARVLS